MSADDKRDYPYAPRYGSHLPRDGSAQSPAGRWFRRWLVRTAIAASAFLIVGIVATAILLARAARQTWRIGEIEQHGGSIWYWHQAPTSKDMLPEFMRERVGDRWWSDVREVSHDPFFFGRRDELSSDDVKAICEACGGLRKLRSFSINSDAFSCDLLKDWPQLHGIEELKIGSARLTDKDLAIIRKMTSLKTLKIGGAAISGVGIGHLGSLPRLERLTLESVSFSDSVSGIAQGFGSLKGIVVSNSPDFDDDAIKCFGQPLKLEEINFNKTPIGDKGLVSLMRGGKVRSLIVNEGALTDAAFAILSGYPAPGWLVLSGMPLTDEGLRHLANKEFPTLILDGTLLTDESLCTLNEIKGVEFVSFGRTRITGTGGAYLGGERSVKRLDLSGSTLTAEGIRALAMTNCSELNLAQTPIDDKGLLGLQENDHLIQLDLTQTAITPDGLRAFYKARKDRMRASGTQDTLILLTDFPDLVASITGRDPETGLPLVADASGESQNQ